jgi:hypothetical protein
LYLNEYINDARSHEHQIDFQLFPTIKEFLGVRRIQSNEEMKDAVKQWLNALATEVYDESIQKLVTNYDKCLNVGGDSAEK